ncbi:MAG: homocysteine S-methyltransferase family protein [Myxococcota bacterium]
MAAHGITGQGGSPDTSGSDERPIAAEVGGLPRRLRGPAPLVLDGATGTELERRGVPVALPLWSAQALLEAPAMVETIHRDYLAAGADVLTANTFRTHTRSLAHAGLGGRALELTTKAVELARSAAGTAGRKVYVLGSAAPLEDCYRPDRVPPDSELVREHAAHARHLAHAGVDAVLVETQNTIREARIAAAAARETGLPFLVCFVCGANARLLSGESLAEAARALAPLAPCALGVNCLPPRAVPSCLDALAAPDTPLAVYANLGAPGDDPTSPRSDDCSPQTLADHARGWAKRGVRLLGGCCGTTPEHLRALAAAVRPGA